MITFTPDVVTLSINRQERGAAGIIVTGGELAGPDGTTENLLRIGHTLLTRVMAFLGGHLSRSLQAGDSGGVWTSSHPTAATTGIGRCFTNPIMAGPTSLRVTADHHPAGQP